MNSIGHIRNRQKAAHQRYPRLLACFVCLLLMWAGCLLPQPTEETGKLYHHNWWNYYSRGTFLLRQGRTAEAQADFQRCLGLRPGAKFGNTHDMWRARTYGLHFVEGYFPNRELGICLYESNQFTQSVHFLEISMQQEPSGRAKHYLNLARRRQMTGCTVPPPHLQLDRNAETSFTHDRSCLLGGTATGEGRICRLTVGGRPEFIELAENTLTFIRRAPLTAGTNIFSIEAEDLLGQRAAKKVVWIADWQPPRFLIRRVSTQGGAWLVEGVCRDEFGLAEVLLDHTSVFRLTDTRHMSEFPVSLRVPLTGATLTATDRAGNRLQSPLNATVLAQMAVPEERTPLQFADRVCPFPSGKESQPLRAFAALCLSALPNATLLSRMEAHARAFERGSTPMGLFVQTVPAPTTDRLRPSLSLRGCQPLTRVFAEDFYVDGTAADGGGLVSVTINGENLLAPDDRGTIRTYFARRITLDPGTNRFDVVATDRTGNQASQTLTVIRLSPEHLAENLRLSVGVPPLTPADTGLIGVRVKRSMETELTKSPVRFRLLERDEGWNFVLREQGLSVSDLADPSAALRIGKMVPAEMLLMGKIFTEAKGLTVYLKAVETGNGTVVFASDVYSPDSDLGLDNAVAGLVLKVQQGFPLITGEVLRRQGTHVTLNVGRQEGTTENSRFLVISASSAKSITDGQVCKAEGQAIQLQIESVQQNTSTARIIPPAADAIVKEGYYVYTR